MSIKGNIIKLAGETKPVVIAGRMAESGCDVTETSVRRWLDPNSKGIPEPYRMPFLARALNVTVDALYDGVMPSEVA